MRKDTISLIALIIILIIGFTRIGMRVYANYEYKKEISNNWNLADKASTISQKSEYINKFVLALENENLKGVNANYFFPTQNTEFDENLKALKSLQSRLNTISAMDENSFAYQTAIQQITEQEQGQANDMLEVFYDCWLYKNYYTLWNTLISIIVGIVSWGGLIILVIVFEDL